MTSEDGTSSLPALARLLQEEFATAFAFYDGGTGAPHLGAAGGCAPEQVKRWSVAGTPIVMLLPDRQYQLVLPLGPHGGPALVAVGRLPGLARTADEVPCELQRLERWVTLVAERLQRPAPGQRTGGELEPAQALPWEALGALEHLTRRLRVYKDTTKNQTLILRAAAEVLRVQALLWVPHGSESEVLTWSATDLPAWDGKQLAHRLLRSPDLAQRGYLVLNDVPATNWGAGFPRLANLLALALRDPGAQGLLLALNRRVPADAWPRQRPWSRSEVVTLTPFGALLGLQGNAARRYQEVKDLLVGLVRSLTAAIDAKDAYTFGHSERVGRIASELGRELGLKPEEVSDLYLAGLLHDIGKIGIREEVLGKCEQLTPEEMDHLKQHVIIGHAILRDVQPIRHLLDGVLYHHERIDGGGYPEGLRGEAIPAIARILAVADAYDAMSTTRPYRQALPLDRVEAILRGGAGTQWDQTVIEAFLRCRLRVHAIRQRGIGDSLRQAIHGALRKEDGERFDSTVRELVAQSG